MVNFKSLLKTNEMFNLYTIQGILLI
jgi:hypothetical protein